MKHLPYFLLSVLALSALLPLKADQPPAAPAIQKIVLVGDSTVSSQTGWGDSFLALLGPSATGENMGRGGRSSKSYRAEGHWQKVLNAKPAWVLIQFGHNDMTGKGPKLETDAKTTFRQNLVQYIQELRAIGAQPVLVTSLTRRNFNAVGKIDPDHLESSSDKAQAITLPDTLTDYANATRAVAAEQKVPLIDLNARSIELMNKLGPAAAAAFNRTPTDTTHLSPYGAAETAGLVAEEIRKNVPDLAKLLKN